DHDGRDPRGVRAPGGHARSRHGGARRRGYCARRPRGHHAGRGGGAPVGLHRQLHLGARARRIQSSDGGRDHGRSNPQTARVSHHQDRFPPGPRAHCPACTADFVDHAGHRGRAVRADCRVGAVRASRPAAGGGLFSAMPAGGGTSQTAVNSRAGARTQVAGLVTAATALGTLLLLAPVIALIPQAALAAVVVAYSVELVKPAEFREIRSVRRSEFRWAAIAVLGVLLLGTLKGIIVAVIASLLALAYDAYNPPVYAVGRKRGTNVFRPLSAEDPDDETWPGLLILRTEGRIFFANAQRVGDRVWSLIDSAGPRVLVIDGRGIV